MALSAIAVERLTKLADYMDTLQPPPFAKLDMNNWRKDGFICGTSCCAVGWGATMPEFAALGLRIAMDGRSGFPYYAGKTQWEAVFKFFDISRDHAQHLFGINTSEFLKTPQEWAAHCRYFLDEHRPAADPKFKGFMAKATEPVSL